MVQARTTCLLVLSACLPLLLQTASAELLIERGEVTADMSPQSAHFRYELFTDKGTTAESVNLSLPPDARNVRVSLNGRDQRCGRQGDTLFCSVSLRGKNLLVVEFESRQTVFASGEHTVFRSYFLPPASVRAFTLRLQLPRGYVLPGSTDETSKYASPKPDFLFSDGQRIILLWQRRGLAERFDVSVFTTPAAGAGGPPVEVLAGALAVGAVGALAHRRRRRRPRLSPDLPLVEPERKIVEALLKAKGRVLRQWELQEATKLSKARLSRTLRGLEMRGIIEKRPVGNTNEIRLLNVGTGGERGPERPESENRGE